ncbi:MAG: trigger factor, partial [Humidesulfovibrio sp.]|nr:trigger factor [Humidesulfovibrio sp.]
GGFDSVEKMREAIVKSYMHSREQLNKSVAQNKLMDQLLAQVTFDLPPSLVENRIDRLLADLEQRLDRQGKSLESLKKTPDELREGVRVQAEEAARGEILLLAVAKKENFDVTSEEIDAALTQVAMQNRQDLLSVKQYYEENNLIFPLKDRLLADKSIEYIYARAEKTEVDAPAEVKETPSADEKDNASAKPKKPKAKAAKTEDPQE